MLSGFFLLSFSLGEKCWAIWNTLSFCSLSNFTSFTRFNIVLTSSYISKYSCFFPFFLKSPQSFFKGLIFSNFNAYQSIAYLLSIYPKYCLNFLLLDRCLNRRIAFSLICLTLSRVSPNSSPISFNVRAYE